MRAGLLFARLIRVWMGLKRETEGRGRQYAADAICPPRHMHTNSIHHLGCHPHGLTDSTPISTNWRMHIVYVHFMATHIAIFKKKQKEGKSVKTLPVHSFFKSLKCSFFWLKMTFK